MEYAVQICLMAIAVTGAVVLHMVRERGRAAAASAGIPGGRRDSARRL